MIVEKKGHRIWGPLLQRALCFILIFQLVALPIFPESAKAQMNPSLQEQGVKYDVRFDVTGADPNRNVSITYTPGTSSSQRADAQGRMTTGSRIDYTETFRATIETSIADIQNEIEIDWLMERGSVNVTGRASRSASIRVTLGNETKTVIADNNGRFDLGYILAIENMANLITGLQINVINTRCIRGRCAPVNPQGLNISLNSAINYDAYVAPPGTPPPSPGTSNSQMGAIMAILSLLGINLGSIAGIVASFTGNAANVESLAVTGAAAATAQEAASATTDVALMQQEAAADNVARFTVSQGEADQTVAALSVGAAAAEARGQYTGLAQILYERQVRMTTAESEYVDETAYVPGLLDPRDRAEFFFANYCNTQVYPNAEGRGFFAVRCDGVEGDRVDRDINATKIFGTEKLTLNVSFKPNDDGTLPAATEEERAEEKDVLSFIHNVLSFSPPAYRSLIPFGQRHDATSSLKILGAMSLNTLHSFARNSWAHIIGMRAKGEKTIEELGIPAILADYNIDMAQYSEVLGERPSYYAQLEFAARRLYQDPKFYESLYEGSLDIRALRSRRAMIKSLRLQVDREIYQSMQRVETLLVALNEMKLREARR